MASKKRRVFQHIMENDSYQLIKKLLPKEWVIRDFNKPDYGIDLVIELFNRVDEQYSETLGEFIYIQVKSVKSVEVIKEKIFTVRNVAKGAWTEDKSEYAKVPLAPFSVSTVSPSIKPIFIHCSFH